MGADEFSTVAFGKDANAAFRSATEEARYENGHGGYTGTIAEKHGFTLIDLKAIRMTLAKFDKALEAHMDLRYAHQNANTLPNKQTKREQSKFNTKIKRARRAFEKIAGSNADLISRAANTSEDKWGNALAIEITRYCNHAVISFIASGINSSRSEAIMDSSVSFSAARSPAAPCT